MISISDNQTQLNFKSEYFIFQCIVVLIWLRFSTIQYTVSSADYHFLSITSYVLPQIGATVDKGYITINVVLSEIGSNENLFKMAGKIILCDNLNNLKEHNYIC